MGGVHGHRKNGPLQLFLGLEIPALQDPSYFPAKSALQVPVAFGLPVKVPRESFQGQDICLYSSI